MKGSGFTLIELLITVSIIAVLSAVGITSYQGTQARARDAIRKDDLKTLATALELYNQKNGGYVAAGSGADSCNRDTASFYTLIAPFLNKAVPADPLTKQKYCYISQNNNSSYRLFAKLENCSDGQIISGINCQSSTWNYSIVSDNLTIAPAP